MRYKIIDNVLIVNMKYLIKVLAGDYFKNSDLKSNNLSKYINSLAIYNSFIKDKTVQNIEKWIENYLTKKLLNYERVILLSKNSKKTEKASEQIAKIQSYSKLYKSFRKKASIIFNVNPMDLVIIDYNSVKNLKDNFKTRIEPIWISHDIKDFFANEYKDNYFMPIN